MGGTQSTPSRPSSPILASGHGSIERMMPPPSRRLSSFGRSRDITKRTISNTRSTAVEPSGIDLQGDRVRPEGSRDTEKMGMGEERVEEKGLGRAEKRDGDQGGEKWRLQTPSLPTTPGPPVGHCTPQAGPSRSSYFPPLTSTLGPPLSSNATASTIPAAVPIPSLYEPRALSSTSNQAGPSITPTPVRPTHSRYLSLPNPPGPSDRTISGSLTALLGFSAPGESNSPSPATAAAPPLPSNPFLDNDDITNISSLVEDDDSDTDNDADQADPDVEVDAHQETVTSNPALGTLNTSLADLQTRLDSARAELAQNEAEIERLENRRRASRVPIGAMLVIQGLAQTQVSASTVGELAREREAAGDTSGGSSTAIAPGGSGGGAAAGTESGDASSPVARGTRRRPGLTRGISDGSLFRRRRDQEREHEASSEQQARMIGGLLTVAAAATANTLLSGPTPPTTPAPARPGLSGAVQSLLNRLRPNNPTRNPRQGIEEALGQYLRNAIRADQSSPGSPPGSAGDMSALNLPGLENRGPEAGREFQLFLRNLQGDLISAVRAYAVREDDIDEGEIGGEEVEEVVSITEEIIPDPEEGEPTREGSSGVESGDIDISSPSTETTVTSTEPPIPTFHRQLGQNTPGAPTDGSGVTGGVRGSARRLNFFRAHMFPPIAPTTPTPSSAEAATATPGVNPISSPTSPTINSTAETPADTIVPCIFIGVRSIRHQPDTSPEDIFEQPGLFSGQGDAAPSSSTPSTDLANPTPDSPTDADTPLDSTSTPPTSARPSINRTSSSLASTSPPTPTRPRSFRERLLARLSRRTPTRQPLNTYIVYVIGGNYPSNHPVLRIPSLITGEPLSDEDMALISELMGPAKPPTASKDDIDNSNLRIVDGGQMKMLGEKGEVLDNCTERCLICLSDYEEGEECRILGCRHGYHMECVDQWLVKGSNSCPACRTEAVDKKAPPIEPGSAGEDAPYLSPTVPTTSIPAGPSTTAAESASIPSVTQTPPSDPTDVD